MIKELRGKQLGTTLVRNLVAQAKRDIYLVTVIPGFFGRIGFKEAKEFPASIQRKCELCTTHYHVGEEYRVIRYAAYR